MTRSDDAARGQRARSLWYTAPGVAELREHEVPAHGLIRARAVASGISRGTEAMVFAGEVPPSQHDTMRGPNMQGTFDFPVKYGYAWVGETLEAHSRRVFALHPHQDLIALPQEQLHVVPPCVSGARATLAANMETALNALWDSGLDRPDTGPARVTILGAGVVGCLLAHAYRRLVAGDGPACALERLEVVDVHPRRRAWFEAQGIAFASPRDAQAKRDVIFHCTGRPEGLRLALELAAFEARIVDVSWYGEREVELPLGGAFHSQRLTILASQVGHVAPSHRATTSHAQRLAQAIDLLDEPRLDALIGARVPFAEAPGRMVQLFEQSGEHHVLDYERS